MKRLEKLSKIEIAYFKYDPEKDYSGRIGNAIAEAIFKKCGYDTRKVKEWIMMHRLIYLAKKAREEEIQLRKSKSEEEYIKR